MTVAHITPHPARAAAARSSMRRILPLGTTCRTREHAAGPREASARLLRPHRYPATAGDAAQAIRAGAG